MTAAWRKLYGEQPIAVVGMSGTYPGGADLDRFWERLRSGRDSIEPVSEEDLAAARVPPSADRAPDYVRACSPIENFDRFDAAFFGVSPAEARITDPQHRLFLQHSYLALEQAGYASARGDLAVGVFGGIGVPSYMIELAVNGADRTTATAIMPIVIGTDKDYLATAVAYRLDLHGPAMTIQTACSTSLVAIHVAVQSLLSQECDLALAGGSSVRIPHRAGYVFQSGGIMSRDGYCRSFDESATGTIFASGAGVVALRRLDDALAAGDPIRAVILGSAVNNDGARKVGYAAPSVDGQVAVISEALAVAGLDPDQVDYVEAHGTGTRIGDAIEATSLTRVFASAARKKAPCLVGSVKSNVGHLEAAAGVVAFSKTALALENNWLPPSLFVERPIAEVRASGALEMARTGGAWPQRGALRVAGVSSFGVGGTNAHVLLASPPPRTQRAETRTWHVARLSAKTPASLSAAAQAMAGWLDRNPDAAPASVAASLDRGRPAYAHTAAIAFQSAADLSKSLRALAEESASAPQRAAVLKAPKVAMLFSGQGATLRGAAAQLYAQSEVVARAIDEADGLLRATHDVPVRDILVAGTTEPAEPRLVQPLSVALHIALIRLWESMGLAPALALGHSIGEIAAAVATGMITADSALAFAAARGEIMQRLCPEGAMAAVAAPPQRVKDMLAGAGLGEVAIAAINGPNTTVIAGAPADVAAANARAASMQIAAVALPVARAYHSALVEPALREIGAAAALLRAGTPRATLISTLTGEALSPQAVLAPRHWQDHARASVLFEPAVRGAIAAGATEFIELGPEPQLAVHVKSIAPDAHVATTLTRRDKSLRAVLGAGVALQNAGVALDLVRADGAARLPVPGYAFQPDRHWMDESARDARPASGAHVWTFPIGAESHPYLVDHRIAGRIVVPGTLYVELALAVAADVLNAPASVSNIVFHQPLLVPEDGEVEVRLSATPLGPGLAAFAVETVGDGRAQRIASGQIEAREQAAPSAGAPDIGATAAVPVDAFYATLAAMGLDYGPTFRGIVDLRAGRNVAAADVRIAAGLAADIASYILHPAVLDSCLHVGGAAMAQSTARGGGYLPVGIRCVSALRPLDPGAPLHVTAVRRETGDADTVAFDIRVSDEQGLVATVDRLTLGKAAALSAGRRSGAAFHRAHWIEAETSAPGTRPLLVVAHAGDTLAQSLCDALRAQGADVALADQATADLRKSFNGTGPNRRVVYLGPPPTPAARNDADSLWQACEPALRLARLMPRSAAMPGLTIVTRGGVATESAARDVLSASLWSCGTSLVSERPDLDVRLIDLDSARDPLSLAALADAVRAQAGENRLAIRAGRMMVQRLEAHEPEPHARVLAQQMLRLETERPGSLDDLAFYPLDVPEPGPTQVRVRVEAASLNFLDVLAALGERPDLPAGACTAIGSEYAGLVEAVGSAVTGLAVGDRVAGIAPGSIATHVLVEAADAHRYGGLTPAEAAAIPVCHGTAEYALRDIAHLSSGDSVLIHAASGGVGLAAVAVARSVGARILATAGSDEKRDELRRRGLSDVFDSRSLSFVDGARAATDGRGVDVVLNALTNPLLQGGLDSLAPFGRFVDIAKRDIQADGALALGAFRRNLSYSAFDLIRLYVERPQDARRLVASVLERVASGIYERPAVTIFPASDAAGAFQLMARAKHIGKIVLDFSSPPDTAKRTVAAFRADGAYVVSGGLGALGLAVARRMVQGGARHLVLISRSAASPAVTAELAALRGVGCTVTVLRADVTDAPALRRALATVAAPVRGVVHAAGVLDDAPIEEMDAARFRAVVAPKLGGLAALASALDPAALDFLAVFSSTSAIFAPPHQAAYAAANGAMEALAGSLGGRVIRWGAWAGGGMASRSGANAIGYAFGLPPILTADGAEAFTRFLAGGLDDATVLAIDPERLGRGAQQFGATALLQALIGETQTAKATGLLASLATLDADARIAALREYLVGEIARTIGAKADEIDAGQDFRSLGIDSLAALELAKRIERGLGVALNPTLLAAHPTAASLAPAVARLLPFVEAEDAPPPEATSTQHRPVA